jgi:protein-L-isoaspartate(D-aspartate) O-methyltransferase
VLSDRRDIVAIVTDHEQQATELRTALTEQIERDFPRVTEATMAAIRRVPRHQFVPTADLTAAYADDVVSTRRDANGRAISSISQPSLVAQMIDMLDLQPGLKVLEIGVGSGLACRRPAMVSARMSVPTP